VGLLIYEFYLLLVLELDFVLALRTPGSEGGKSRTQLLPLILGFVFDS